MQITLIVSAMILMVSIAQLLFMGTVDYVLNHSTTWYRDLWLLWWLGMINVFGQFLTITSWRLGNSYDLKHWVVYLIFSCGCAAGSLVSLLFIFRETPSLAAIIGFVVILIGTIIGTIYS